MTVTYLVAITLDDASGPELSMTADDIHDDLVAAGHDVESVKPWARPTDPASQPAGGFTSLQTNPEVWPTPPTL